MYMGLVYSTVPKRSEFDSLYIKPIDKTSRQKSIDNGKNEKQDGGTLKPGNLLHGERRLPIHDIRKRTKGDEEQPENYHAVKRNVRQTLHFLRIKPFRCSNNHHMSQQKSAGDKKDDHANKRDTSQMLAHPSRARQRRFQFSKLFAAHVKTFRQHN